MSTTKRYDVFESGVQSSTARRKDHTAVLRGTPLRSSTTGGGCYILKRIRNLFKGNPTTTTHPVRLLVGSGIQEKRSRSRSVDDKASVSAIKAKRRDGSRQGLSTGGGESRKHASRDRSKNCGPSSEEQRRRSKSRKATAPPVPSGRAAPGQQRMDRSEREHRRHPSDPRKKDRQNRSERHRKTAAVKSDRTDKSGDDAQSRQSHSPTSSIVARVGSAALSTFQSRDVNTQSPSGTHPQSQSHSGQCQQSGATLQRVHDEPVTQTPFQATYHTTTNVNRNFNYGDATSGTEIACG
ncbi:Protein of unknown function [Pyronema omphalodes CBS 100304]|uniref:Uncharacterized protein n=1 Tax=Pyronema omphalodes (strain CBS 100304) TaxID=1076935 RepID=U4LAN5_PYROM|nr:Protein of unknown function [Pyronema omphalodes CBS 100304]